MLGKANKQIALIYPEFLSISQVLKVIQNVNIYFKI